MYIPVTWKFLDIFAPHNELMSFSADISYVAGNGA